MVSKDTGMPQSFLKDTPLTSKSHTIAARWVIGFSAPVVFFHVNEVPPEHWPLLSHVFAGWPQAAIWSLVLNSNTIALLMLVILGVKFEVLEKIKRIENSARSAIHEIDLEMFETGRPDEGGHDEVIRREAQKQSALLMRVAAVIEWFLQKFISYILPGILGVWAILIALQNLNVCPTQ